MPKVKSRQAISPVPKQQIENFPWFPIALIFLIALVLRLIYLYQVNNDVFMRHLIVDAEFYDAWAKRIVAGGWFSREVFFQDPLYAYILAIQYKIFGASHLMVRLIQAALDSSVCVLLFSMARLLKKPAAGLIAAGLYAACGAAIHFVGLLDKTTWTVFLVGASLLLLIHASLKKTPFFYFLSGAAFGLTSLIRGNMILVALLLAIALLLIERKNLSPAFRLKLAGSFLAGTLLLAGLATFHNWFAGRDFVPISANAGWIFFYSNDPSSLGSMAEPPYACTTPECEAQSSRFLAEKMAGRPMPKSGEISRFWARTTISRILSRPLPWLGLLERKLYTLQIQLDRTVLNNQLPPICHFQKFSIYPS